MRPLGEASVIPTRLALVVGQISAALNRLDAGTYGHCTRCGVRIAPARLQVVPHVAACIECQSRADAA